MSVAATEATASSPAAATPPTLAERRTALAERRHDLAERREARESGLPAADFGADTGSGLSRKLGPLPVWAWGGIAILGIVAVWLIYKQYQAGKSSSSSASTSGGCLDTSGNSVPCGQVDYGGEIATLQSEIQNLQGQNSTPGGSTGGQPGAPTGLNASGGKGMASFSWNAAPGASSYVVIAGGPSQGSVMTTTTSAEIQNLKAGSYTWTVTPYASGGSASAPARGPTFKVS